MFALSDGGTSRPADVDDRSALAGACCLTQCLEADGCSSVEGLEGQHHYLELDVGHNRKSGRIKSVPQPPLRNRDNSNMTSHLPKTDSEVTGSSSYRRYSTYCSQSLMHDTFTSDPSFVWRTRSLQECPASSLHLHESDNSCPVLASQLGQRQCYLCVFKSHYVSNTY